MNETIATDDFKPTEVFRNLKPGDAPVIADIKHYKVAESTRVRENKASGARFNIKRNQAARIITITCIERPLFYSPHGITVKARYVGDNKPRTDDTNVNMIDGDEVHILKVYTGDECIFSHKQDGTFSRRYESFSDFTHDWEVIDPA